MKLSKKVWLIIAGGIFVIALAGLFMVYSGKATEQAALNEQSAQLQLRLSGLQLAPLTARQAELEERLSQVTPQLAATKAHFSQPVSSVNVTDVLFALAKAYGATVTEMTSANMTTETREGVTFSVLPVVAKVDGKALKMVTFITKLNSYFATGVIKSVTITAPETTGDELVFTDNVSAVIQLAVYSYQGD